MPKKKLSIEVDCEEKLCGDCEWHMVDDGNSYECPPDYCEQFGDLKENSHGRPLRCQQCLDAEVKS